MSTADGNLTVEEPKPIEAKSKSNIDLIDECDNFPYYEIDTAAYLNHIEQYYALKVSKHPDLVLGYLLPSFVELLRGVAGWQIDDKERSLTLVSNDDEAERSKIVATTTEALRRTGHYDVLKGWRNELYPVYGPKKELLFSVERAASALFGVITYGCHMTAYVRSNDGLKIWVPRRAASKQTYGGMLDNTAAGGLATGEVVLDCIVRESAEEASLSEDFVRENVKAVGSVTYFHIRDERAGGETGLLQPECEYVYDLELSEDIIPRPNDDEVQSFNLMDIASIQQALAEGQFKPNCALVLLDFFIRHGILTAKDQDYVEIVARLHRRLGFPTA